MGGGGRGHPGPEIGEGGRSQKFFFPPFGPQFGLEKEGGVGPLSWTRQWNHINPSASFKITGKVLGLAYN